MSTSDSELVRTILVALHVVALGVAFFGVWLAWHGITKRAEEAEKQTTSADLLNLRPMIFGKFNRESKVGVALVAVGAVMNTGASIWSLWQ